MIRLRRSVVLAYHGVDPVTAAQDPDRLIVSPDHLRSHIATLKRLGYSFSTVDRLIVDHSVPRPPPATAVLTFDDGWAGWLDHALPVLKDLEIRASFYVCPGWWERAEHPEFHGSAGKLLDEAGVRTLHAAGMEIGAHSMTHPDLRKLDDDRLAWELEASKAAIEDATGVSCRTLAYPYGLYDRRVMEAARTAGFEVALDWLPGRWRALAVPRLPAPPHRGGLTLALKMLGLRRPGR